MRYPSDSYRTRRESYPGSRGSCANKLRVSSPGRSPHHPTTNGYWRTHTRCCRVDAAGSCKGCTCWVLGMSKRVGECRVGQNEGCTAYVELMSQSPSRHACAAKSLRQSRQLSQRSLEDTHLESSAGWSPSVATDRCH